MTEEARGSIMNMVESTSSYVEEVKAKIATK